jgi:hypothetical protein
MDRADSGGRTPHRLRPLEQGAVPGYLLAPKTEPTERSFTG